MSPTFVNAVVKVFNLPFIGIDEGQKYELKHGQTSSLTKNKNKIMGQMRCELKNAHNLT